jgi:hypothetical protein
VRPCAHAMCFAGIAAADDEDSDAWWRPQAVALAVAPPRLNASSPVLCLIMLPACLPCCSRAAHYEDLMNAEAQGKSGKKGQWSNKEPPRPHVNDVSLPGNATRWTGAG